MMTHGRKNSKFGICAGLFLTWILALPASPTSAEPVQLVKDINPGVGSPSISSLTVFDGALYFVANDGIHGSELWKSDVTEAGTVMLKDIRVGVGQSIPTNLTNVNGTLFFSANDGPSGIELWKSDGTEAGTVLVKDIKGGSLSSNPDNFTDVNGTLFFRVKNGTNGTELWKSDGTEAGTLRVKIIDPSSLTNVNGTLFFVALGELWKSDGTETGTLMVKDIFSGGSSFPSGLTNVNGTLLFSANNSTSVYSTSPGGQGRELWKSDGTTTGTVLVKNIYNKPDCKRVCKVNIFICLIFPFPKNFVKVCRPRSSLPQQLTAVKDKLFLTAITGKGRELWKSNGTATGTAMVKNISAGAGSSSPRNLTDVNGTLYFSAFDGSGTKLWRSKGSSKNTIPLSTVKPFNLGSAGNHLFFSADDGVHGMELWISDGTVLNTIFLTDINPGVSSSNPRGFITLGSTLFFLATRADLGQELWALKNYDANSDGDGIIDLLDFDDDNDGVLDVDDAFPLDPTETVDTDGDGVGDNGDAFPNDPTESADTDGDGIGNNADLDDDNDGVPDTGDAFPLDPSETVDTDGDGVGDNADAFPNDPTETVDTDGDGIGDNTDAFILAPAEFELQGIMAGTLICDSGLGTSTKEKFKDEATFKIDLSDFPTVVGQIQLATTFADPFTLMGMSLLKNPKSGVLQLFGDDGGMIELAVSGAYKMNAETQVWVSLKGKFQLQDNDTPVCTLAGKFKAK